MVNRKTCPPGRLALQRERRTKKKSIVPFLFLYGNLRGEEDFKDKALHLLEEVPPEKNSTISKWKELGMEPKSAYQTQALLQLKNVYCNNQQCLKCAIGGAILS